MRAKQPAAYDRDALMVYFRCYMRAVVDEMIEEQNKPTKEKDDEGKKRSRSHEDPSMGARR